MGTCVSAGAAVWVATDLDIIESRPPYVLADDVVVSGVCYRRLDPPYYAWLRRNVARAREQFDAGRLPQDRFEEIRRRFAQVHALALPFLGEDALREAARTFDSANYAPPRIGVDGLPVWDG